MTKHPANFQPSATWTGQGGFMVSVRRRVRRWRRRQFDNGRSAMWSIVGLVVLAAVVVGLVVVTVRSGR